MGLLDLHAAQAGVNEPPLQALPRTLGERVEATAAEVFAPDRYFTLNVARRDMWQRAVDELHGATGEALPNPYGAVTPEEMMRLGNQPAIETERRNAIIEKARAARETNPDLFDPENIDRYIGEEANRRREKAHAYEGTGNGVLNFLASAVLETATPHGVVGLVVPVTRLPGAAASAIGRTFLGNVLREAAFQGGANAALQAGAEGLDYLSRSETGTAQTAGEIAASVAGAALIGGAIGGGVRALHLKWLGLPEKVRADAPLEVRDAFRVIEAESLYSGQNRLGVDPLLHERYQGNAMDAVMRGRPVDLADLTRTADTPMTALGRVLQMTPDEIRVQGLEGLGNAMDRVRALPDRELESVAREIAPRPFERLDRIEADLSAARARIAELEGPHTVADLLDPDTAMRVQEIERDLAAPALKARDRKALEAERDMILQSVDPKDRLPKELEKKVRAQRADVEKQIARLEAQREEAAAKGQEATADLRRKLDRYAFAPGFEWAGRPDQPWAGPAIAKDLGFKEPGELGAAIARADALRQARMVREIVPEGISPQRPPASVTAAPVAPKEITPEQARALDTETRRLLEDKAIAGREVSVDGKVMSAAQAMEDADRMAKDAQAALGCAMGAL